MTFVIGIKARATPMKLRAPPELPPWPQLKNCKDLKVNFLFSFFAFGGTSPGGASMLLLVQCLGGLLLMVLRGSILQWS